MRKNLLMLGSLVFSMGINAQEHVLTYVGDNASLTVKSGALVYSGGGWKNDVGGKVNNAGDIMVVGKTADNDVFDIGENAEFRLAFNPTDKSDYGQLYISGVDQGKISGKVVKEYMADANHGSNEAKGWQQIALPFYNLSVDSLKAVFPYLQTTSTSLNAEDGRFNPASVFKWNNQKIRFDQITGTTAIVGKATDYYIIPRRDKSGLKWDAAVEMKGFVGTPYSDAGGTDAFELEVLDTNYISDLGPGGNTKNYYAERYNSYLDDPFVDGSISANWRSGGDYGKNLSQFANPYLTNLDLTNLKTNGTDVLENVKGIAYYGANSLNWYYGGQGASHSGTLYNKGNIIMVTVSGGAIQAGDLSGETAEVQKGKLVIKPMGEIMVKLNSNSQTTINLNDARSFSQTPRSNGYDVNGRAAATIPADKIVKQVSITLYNAEGKEVGKTHYAVSPSAATGQEGASLQGYVENYPIYTKEEKADGGEDTNYTSQLYINEANEVNFKGKQIPLFINFDGAATMKFEVYEGGEKVQANQQLSSGDFYIESGNNIITKINSGDSIPVTQNNYGLYFGLPEGATLGTGTTIKNQTIIAKKDNDWVIRFSKDWKKAKVEVYSAAGQLIHVKENVNTGTDYIIPVSTSVNNVYVVKTTSETGNVVIKKIVK